MRSRGRANLRYDQHRFALFYFLFRRCWSSDLRRRAGRHGTSIPKVRAIGIKRRRSNEGSDEGEGFGCAHSLLLDRELLVSAEGKGWRYRKIQDFDCA